MLDKLARTWALDLRSLAVVRMAYGLILLCDILIRATDLVAHYTDWGLAPRSAVLELSQSPGFFSIHMMNGTWPFEAFLFTIGALACICLSVGYQTRLAGWVTWVHLISMHNRNPMVLDGGDIYIRVVMFWLLFLPWGARWSIDAYRAGLAEASSDEETEIPGHIFNIASLAYMVQLSLVYVMAWVLKTGAEWNSPSYQATYYALMIEQLTTPLAPLLLQHPDLLKLLTMSVVKFEGLGPLLLWMPAPFRLLGVLGIGALHIGFGAFMHLAIFVPIGVCSAWGLIPAFFWDWFEPTGLFQALKRLTLLLAEQWPFPGRGAVPVKSPSQLVTSILVILLAEVIVWNISDQTRFRAPLRRDIPEEILSPFRLDQKSNMFAPRPLDEDGWYVIEANQINGGQVDLFRDGAPVAYLKPHRIAAMYPNARWRKFMMNIWSRDNSDWRLYYGRYLTRKWNTTHKGGEQIKTFTINFMLKKTLPDGKSAPIEKVSIWSHHCFDSPAPDATSANATAKPTSSPTPGLPSLQILPRTVDNSTLMDTPRRPTQGGTLPVQGLPNPATGTPAPLKENTPPTPAPSPSPK